jgi:hypothetical protein
MAGAGPDELESAADDVVVREGLVLRLRDRQPDRRVGQGPARRPAEGEWGVA